MILSQTKYYNNHSLTITVDWKTDDYDIVSIDVEKNNTIIDVIDIFTSDEMITEVFGPIDWQLIYNQNHT